MYQTMQGKRDINVVHETAHNCAWTNMTKVISGMVNIRICNCINLTDSPHSEGAARAGLLDRVIGRALERKLESVEGGKVPSILTSVLLETVHAV